MKLHQKKFSLNLQKVTALTLIVFLYASQMLFAQQQKQARANPVPVGEPVKSMEKLMGKWEGIIHSETGPVVTKKDIKASFDFSPVFKNLAVKASTRFEVIDTPKVTEGTMVIGFDATDKQYHLLMMNDEGEAYDLNGKWINDYNLNFSCNTERGGKKIGLTLYMNIKTPGELGYKMYTSIGESLLITDEGKLMRKKTEAVSADKKPVPKK
jgi:hypothetical protein